MIPITQLRIRSQSHSFGIKALLISTSYHACVNRKCHLTQSHWLCEVTQIWTFLIKTWMVCQKHIWRVFLAKYVFWNAFRVWLWERNFTVHHMISKNEVVIIEENIRECWLRWFVHVQWDQYLGFTDCVLGLYMQSIGRKILCLFNETQNQGSVI